jgi:DNA-directed RNA polymerase specialized sigma24 family protein
MRHHKLAPEDWKYFEPSSHTPPAARALALDLVTRTDLLRLKAIARLHARGLPPEFDWSDLLQEAFARVLDGRRKQPEGLPMVVFLAGVMRSLRAQFWRNSEIEGIQADVVDPTPDVERSLIAAEELLAIDRLFADDLQARAILSGLGSGLTPEEVRSRNKISKTDYDSTRRRMRRALLREGIRMPQP